MLIPSLQTLLMAAGGELSFAEPGLAAVFNRVAAHKDSGVVLYHASRDSVVLPIVGMRVYPGTALHRRAMTEGAITADADLLEPFHYIAPGLSAEQITGRLAEFVKTDPNWIIGEPPPSFHQVVERLRSGDLA